MVGELNPKPPRLFQTLDVLVDGRPPSLNARRHWRAIAADNRTWKANVLIVALDRKHSWEQAHGLRWRPLRLCTLNVIFYVGTKRARDWDNLISTIKPEIDALVEAGIIVDDSNEVIQSIAFFIEYEKGTTATLFTIRELDER